MYFPIIGARSCLMGRDGVRPGDDGRREGRAHAHVARRGILATASAMIACAVRAFCRQVGDDHLHRHRVVVRVPAVVVGDQRERRVADLRLARQLGLLQVGHPDDVHPPGRYSFDSASVENCGPSMQT